MPGKAQDDDLVMGLVEQALGRPAAERELFTRRACGGNPELFEEVWRYVQSEQRMNGFLLEPLCSPGGNGHPVERPFEPGDFLEGRFRIVREVAQGGMGIVYEALDDKLDRRIALKCAKSGFGNRLPPEVRYATTISHPNVCKIYEIHTASTARGPVDFLTMEYLEGETLADRLGRGPIPENAARTLALQLCAGLAEAHRNHVIHGDLKSSNVILSNAGDGSVRAVITDFGLARRPDASMRAVQSDDCGGTPGYMAPELFEGARASVQSDIYALGVILRELDAGRGNWDRLLARCLDPKPARRFQSVDHIAALLAPRSRTWMAALAAALLLAVASGVVAYERAKPAGESVRLAMLPFESGPSADSFGKDLFRDAAGQLARLKGSARTNLTVIPAGKTLQAHAASVDQARALFGATHVLHATLERDKEKLLVDAFLTDARSRVNTKEWKAEYAPGETRFIPAALMEFVTAALHIPPPAQAAALNPGARSDYLKGLSYLHRDSGIDTALAFLERASVADPDSPLTHAALAEGEWFKYYLTKDEAWLLRAAESARRAELRSPDSAAVHRIKGVLLVNSGRYEQAEAEYRRAIELEPGNGDAHRRLGQVYERNGQSAEALAAYRRAVDAEPKNYRTYQALGNFYYKQANYNEAYRYVSKAVELAPEEPTAHFALGSVLTYLGRFADAESELRFATRLRETPTALYALGHVLMYEDKDKDAVPYFLAALKATPENVSAWRELGNCYRRTNTPADAKRAYERALELAEAELGRNPRDGEVRSSLAYLCARLGDRRRAESEIAQALQSSPNDGDTQWRAALTFEALGRRDATLALLRTAPMEVVNDLNRWPDVADLRADSRFLQLLASHQH